MRFQPTPIAGAWVIELERREDDRGFFARTWCAEEFSRRGLNPALAQTSISYNQRRGTLRGMHWQAAPNEEAKLVRCTRGAIFDVCVDLRRASPTLFSWYGTDLTSENRAALYVPEGCAHGFLTRSDDAEVLYLISVPHRPEAARGFRWDDPAVSVRWPEDVRVVSERDKGYPPLEAHPE